MTKTCRRCGCELVPGKHSGARCNPCVHLDSKARKAKATPVVLGLNCPWQNPNFLRGWQGRLPDPEWGF